MFTLIYQYYLNSLVKYKIGPFNSWHRKIWNYSYYHLKELNSATYIHHTVRLFSLREFPYIVLKYPLNSELFTSLSPNLIEPLLINIKIVIYFGSPQIRTLLFKVQHGSLVRPLIPNFTYLTILCWPCRSREVPNGNTWYTPLQSILIYNTTNEVSRPIFNFKYRITRIELTQLLGNAKPCVPEVKTSRMTHACLFLLVFNFKFLLYFLYKSYCNSNFSKFFPNSHFIYLKYYL